jgi:hypothetical protein
MEGLLKSCQVIAGLAKSNFATCIHAMGQLNSMHSVLERRATLFAEILQTIVIIRNFSKFTWLSGTPAA